MPEPHTISNAEFVKAALDKGELEGYDVGAAKLIMDLCDQLELFHSNAHEKRHCNLDEIGVQTFELLFSTLTGVYLQSEEKSKPNAEAIDMLFVFACAGIFLAHAAMNKEFGSLQNPERVKRLVQAGLDLAIIRQQGEESR